MEPKIRDIPRLAYYFYLFFFLKIQHLINMFLPTQLTVIFSKYTMRSSGAVKKNRFCCQKNTNTIIPLTPTLYNIKVKIQL